MWIEFDWNYDDGYVNIKMTNYVSDALYNFQHIPPSQPPYQPHSHNPIWYGDKRQYAKGPNLYKHINKKERKHVQSVIVTLLYYEQAIESTVLPVLNDISSQHSQPTEETMKK